jgi:trypsin-like peptidase
LANGQSSVGTGFFFQFPYGADQHIPTIVTNIHVIRGSVSCNFRFTALGSDGAPNYEDAIHFDLPIPEANWIKHPDATVDLAILPIGPLIAQMRAANKLPYYVTLSPDLIPNASALTEIGAVEDILMIGYPNGLWDSVNNRPIARSGTTATHPALDYEGRREFMIDAACFPGSSGSPVVLLNQSSYVSRSGSVMMGQGRLLLLGILYAGPMYTANGDIRVVDVPTQLGAVALSQIPMNLGLVIKSSRLLEFQQPLMQRAGLIRT